MRLDIGDGRWETGDERYNMGDEKWETSREQKTVNLGLILY
jgi:hypothetical protein